MIDIIEILVSINGAKATMLEEIYSNNANQYRALIKFEDDSWNNYDKMIVFDRVKNYDTPIGIMVEEDNKELIEIIDQQSFYCVIPWEVLTQPGYFTISIHGALDNSQKSLTIKNKFTIYDGGNATIYPRVPTPNMYEQLFGKVKELSKKIDVNTKSDAGRTTPEGGEIFNDYETNQALGLWSHVEGGRCKDPDDVERHNVAKGTRAHIEGSGNTVTEDTYDAHVEGSLNIGAHNQVHVEGYNNIASEHQAHAEGHSNEASGIQSHTEGWKTKASGQQSHSEGVGTEASGDQSHTEGIDNTASGAHSHSEGQKTTASGTNSHTEGQNSQASGHNSHSEGNGTKASAMNSHSEGEGTEASGQNSHTEGANTKASGKNSHAEGQGKVENGQIVTGAFGNNSHTEGYFTTASGDQSHAEGHTTTASGGRSHASGLYTLAKHAQSFVHGARLESGAANQFVIGQFNEIDGKAIFVVGNGTGGIWDGSNAKRSNAFSVYDGYATVKGVKEDNDLSIVNLGYFKKYISENLEVDISEINTYDLLVNNNQIRLGYESAIEGNKGDYVNLTKEKILLCDYNLMGQKSLSLESDKIIFTPDPKVGSPVTITKNGIEISADMEYDKDINISWREIGELPEKIKEFQQGIEDFLKNLVDVSEVGQ